MAPLFVVAPPMFMTSMFEDLWQNAGIRDGSNVEPENIRTEIVQEENFFFNVDRTTQNMCIYALINSANNRCLIGFHKAFRRTELKCVKKVNELKCCREDSVV